MTADMEISRDDRRHGDGEDAHVLTCRVVTDITELAKGADDWAALLARSPGSSPTLSPAWLLPWWRIFGCEGNRKLCAVLFSDGPRLVGFAPLLSRPQRSRVGIPYRRIELLASGEDEVDEIGSDYLGVVVDRGEEEAVAQALAATLMSGKLGPWDDVTLRAMDGDSPFAVHLADALAEHGVSVRTEVVAMSHHIHLPPTWDDYLAALPSTRRYLVRRSLRDFERWADGSMRVFRATTREDVSRGLVVLKALHTERWIGAGKSGAFASMRFCAFHESVMPALLDEGALELSWITVRGDPVAAIYNIIWGKKVHFYQAGRAVAVPRNIRPGVVMHTHAIQSAIAAGLEEYDFLQGSARYKSELALASRPIVNLTAVRPSFNDAVRRATELAIEQVRALRHFHFARRKLVPLASVTRAPAGP